MREADLRIRRQCDFATSLGAAGKKKTAAAVLFVHS